MQRRFPRKLRAGDTLRVVAPAHSRVLALDNDLQGLIDSRFEALGLVLTDGEHVGERDALDSSSIESRIAGDRDAFADPDVAGVITVLGGYNSNELLPHLDFDLIASNPKVLCGYSNITALQNAVRARTGLVTYPGPHWSSFAIRDHFEQTLRWFEQALFEDGPIDLRPSATFTDDAWFLDQDDRQVHENDGWWPLQEGRASGQVIGTNLCTLNLLQGTSSMPSLDGALLMLENDFESNAPTFARDLTSLLQLPDAAGVVGLVIGRFQRSSAVDRRVLEQIVASQPLLVSVPVLANADFGHSGPLATLPLGGTVPLLVGVDAASCELVVTEH